MCNILITINSDKLSRNYDQLYLVITFCNTGYIGKKAAAVVWWLREFNSQLYHYIPLLTAETASDGTLVHQSHRYLGTLVPCKARMSH